MKYWFITSIAKLLLFTYVAFEAVLGLSATVGGGLSRAASWKMRLLGHYIGENAVNLRRVCAVREFVLCAGDPLLQGEYQSCMLLSLYGSENACFAPVCGWGCAVFCSSPRGLPPHHQSAAPMASVRYPGRWALLALRGVHVLQGHDSWSGTPAPPCLAFPIDSLLCPPAFACRSARLPNLCANPCTTVKQRHDCSTSRSLPRPSWRS